MIESPKDIVRIFSKIRSGKLGRDEVLIKLYKDEKLRNGFKKMISSQNWPASIFDHLFDTALTKCLPE